MRAAVCARRATRRAACARALSYHCGFSHGLNCAESTNFAAEDWLPWGSRAARESRASPGARALCFNHEHLLCALAQRAIDAARARANVCTPRGVRGGLCAPLAGASLCVYFLGWLQPEVRAMVDGEIAARTALIGRCAGIERTRPIAMRQLPAQLPEHGGKNGAKAATKLHSPNVPSGMPGSSPARASDETPSAAAGCDRAAQCGVCGYELRISWVRCAGCGRCMCLEHLGAEQPRVRDCACAVTAEPPCEADGAAGGDGTRASPGLQLVEAWTVEQLCALRAQLDEVALPYLEWRASVRALRGAALGPLDAEVGAAEARAVCGDGDDEGAEEKAVRAGAEGADDGARGSVVSMAELDRLCAVADELGLDPDDVSASVVHALRTRATMWARAAAAVTRTAVGGAAARMPSGERARDDTPRRLIAEHDDELPVAFAELRASLVALECDVASWTAEAQRLLQVRRCARAPNRRATDATPAPASLSRLPHQPPRSWPCLTPLPSPASPRAALCAARMALSQRVVTGTFLVTGISSLASSATWTRAPCRPPSCARARSGARALLSRSTSVARSAREHARSIGWPSAQRRSR